MLSYSKKVSSTLGIQSLINQCRTIVTKHYQMDQTENSEIVEHHIDLFENVKFHVVTCYQGS